MGGRIGSEYGWRARMTIPFTARDGLQQLRQVRAELPGVQTPPEREASSELQASRVR